MEARTIGLSRTRGQSQRNNLDQHLGGFYVGLYYVTRWVSLAVEISHELVLVNYNNPLAGY